MSDVTDAEVLASLVLKVGLVSGLGLAVVYGWVVRSRTVTETDLNKLAARGRVVDLAGRHEYALAALKHLEVERDKMLPEDYARERAALLAQGAAAMRELDGAGAPQDPSDTMNAAPTAASPSGPADLAAALQALKDAGVELTPTQVAALAAKHLGAPATAPAPGTATRSAPPAPAPTMAPEVKGALWTLGGAAMIGFLLYAMQDSVHERGSGPMTGGMGMGGGGGAAAAMGGGGGGMGGGQPQQAQAPQLDPLMAADKVRFESVIQTNPDDLAALNGLTEIAFAERDLSVAMQRNGRALDVGPNDLLARTYKAVLRSAVGLNDGALEILDGVLAEDPSFTKALVYKGLVTMDLGKYSDAADSFAKVIELEGPNDFIQSRLEDARSLAANPNAAPPRRGPAPPMGGAASGGGGGDPVATGTVIYPDGFQPPPGAILYVSLRAPAGGPPLAAKKFPAGSGGFSFEISTGDAISMGGAPRPFSDTMALSARVDLDGNAMTKEPGMPQATLEVQRGATGLTLHLAQ